MGNRLLGDPVAPRACREPNRRGMEAGRLYQPGFFKLGA